MRRLLLAVLLVSGCEIGFEEPPVNAYLPDDDDSGSEDDDDAADDDDGADDDDAAPVRAAGALIEVQEGEVERWSAALSFHRAEPLEEFLVDDVPLPGIGLHPDLRPAAAPECGAFDSTSGLPDLPRTDPVGGVVTLRGDVEDRPLEQRGGLYVGEGAGPWSASSWDVEVKGGSGWPPGPLGAGLVGPEAVEGILPNAGTIGGLSEIHFSWTADPDQGGVEILLLRFDGVDPDAWRAVRCAGDDVGEVRVRADTLAVGGGPVHVWASRADWARGDDGPQLDIGVVRTVHYELTLAR